MKQEYSEYFVLAFTMLYVVFISSLTACAISLFNFKAKLLLGFVLAVSMFLG